MRLAFGPFQASVRACAIDVLLYPLTETSSLFQPFSITNVAAGFKDFYNLTVPAQSCSCARQAKKPRLVQPASRKKIHIMVQSC